MVAGEKVLMCFFPPKISEMCLGRWWGYQAKGGTIYPIHSLSMCRNTFIYILYGSAKHPSKWGLRLNHDVTTSDRSVPTPKFLKIDPKLRSLSGYLRVVPYTHSQLINVQKHFLNIYYGL